jgi:hypothetical protein
MFKLKKKTGWQNSQDWKTPKKQVDVMCNTQILDLKS